MGTVTTVQELTAQSTGDLRKYIRMLVSQGIVTPNGFTGAPTVAQWINLANKETLLRSVYFAEIAGPPTWHKHREPMQDTEKVYFPSLPDVQAPQAQPDRFRPTFESDKPQPEPAKPQPAPTAQPNTDLGAALSLLQNALESMRGAVDSEQVAKMIDDKIAASVAPSRTITVITPNKTRVDFKHTHKAFETVLTLANTRTHVFMVGPTGSGKTTVGYQVAEALNVAFYPYSCGLEMSRFDFFGFMNAAGSYVPGLLYEPYKLWIYIMVVWILCEVTMGRLFWK